MKFLASDRARLHRGADIIEVREKSKNINFHFSTEQDYIREADIMDIEFYFLFSIFYFPTLWPSLICQ